MLWLRILCGVVFLVWLGCFIYSLWLAWKPLPRPEDWKSDYGRMDPNSEEYRRLILK